MNKVVEAKQILKEYDIENIELDIPEIQGSPEDIAKDKARVACELLNKTVFVEDVSLHFTSFNGLPGPYIKEFVSKMNLDDIYKLLGSFEDKSASAVCSIGYCEPGKKPICIQGKIKGLIVSPRGFSNFGWDPVFQPDGFFKTFAEMSAEEKNVISHRKIALENLKEYLSGLSRFR